MSNLKIDSVSFKQIPAFLTANKTKSFQQNAESDTGIEFVDCTDLYTGREIKKIKESTKTVPSYMYLSEFEISYAPKEKILRVHNKTLTNDTLMIYSDGSAEHTGSLRTERVGETGEFINIIEEAQKRYEASKK